MAVRYRANREGSALRGAKAAGRSGVPQTRIGKRVDMHRRAWSVCARAAVAIAAGVMALAAGGTAVSASPAGAAGAPSSSAIEVSNGQFNVILRDARAGRVAAGEVTAFHGFSTLRSI